MGEHLQKKKFSRNFNLELGRVENIVGKGEISLSNHISSAGFTVHIRLTAGWENQGYLKTV